jgi:hypothetical protein
MDFSTNPMWVQIHDMPLGCINRKIGNKIGSSIGAVEDVAIAEDDVGWDRSLWIRVAFNLFQPLERGRKLNLSGTSCWVSFKYEKLPVFCFRCGCIIHGDKGCSVLWLRNIPMGRRLVGHGYERMICLEDPELWMCSGRPDHHL